MTLEQTLIDELRLVADTTEVPVPPDVAELVRIAERTRTRSLATRVGGSALVAAAVVTAIVIGAQVSRPQSAPPPTKPTGTQTGTLLPVGAPPRIPYVNGSTLYVDGRAQPGNWSDVVTTPNGITSIATLNTEERSGIIVLFRDGREVLRLTDTNGDGAVLSPDGTKMAWVRVRAGSTDVVVLDVVTLRELGRLPVEPALFVHDGEENEAWETLAGITDGGTVSYGSVLVTHTWTPGTSPLDQEPGPYVDPFAGYPQRAEYVWVSPDGRWGAWLTDRDGNPPDDERRTLDGVTLQRPGRPDTRFTIVLPPGTDASGGVRWETSTDLLVRVDGDTELGIWHLLRCDIAERDCERAPTDADQ